jgi:hypothetical protein
MWMNLPTSADEWILVLELFGAIMLIQYAFEGFVVALGYVVVWLFSLGLIKVGVRRSFFKAPPKPDGGGVFYCENGRRYIYRNYLGLIGLAALLLFVFGAIIGIPVYAGTR